ncbi:hypothetical protein ACQP2X_14115 [Actinoplanes sp. CA-131856]
MTEAPNPQPWELGKRYMRGELEAADFLDQSSRDLSVRVSLARARAVGAIIGLFVTVSYTVLALYLLWDGGKVLPGLLSLAGALGVAIFSVTRYRRPD